MISVQGEATLSVRYSVTLNMTEEEFENLSERQQDNAIDNAIDWHSTLRNAETQDIEIYEVTEEQED